MKRQHSDSFQIVQPSSTEMIEILLFSLGGPETFGLNVFKIREVTELSLVTQIPGQQGAMNGVISLRGQVLPVVSLGDAIGTAVAPAGCLPQRSYHGGIVVDSRG